MFSVAQNTFNQKKARQKSNTGISKSEAIVAEGKTQALQSLKSKELWKNDL